MPRVVDRVVLAACLALLAGPALARQQAADPGFRPVVSRPAYPENGPVVVVDEAHHNFHTVRGRYKPFADLLVADGYRVRGGRQAFTREGLTGVVVLVIANADFSRGGARAGAVFTREEIAVVRDWVKDGGALLLIADHAPFGAAAAELAAAFGVEMGGGWVFDRGSTERAISTQLIYVRAAGSLGDHPITRGRDASEAVRVVRAFTGQSLSLPAGAVNLMPMSPTAREAPDAAALQAAAAAAAAGRPFAAAPAGPSQGLAMEYGRGRVVVLGEAGMLSAQVVRTPGGSGEQRFGMNVEGLDNRQFALNVLRWLSGALP